MAGLALIHRSEKKKKSYSFGNDDHTVQKKKLFGRDDFLASISDVIKKKKNSTG